MSKYTTEVRYICEHLCGLDASKGYNDIGTIIANARGKLFDFQYPIFDETYRSVLETKIIKHYYTREIGEETVGLWKLRLDRKLNEIMPYYNQLYKSELFQFDPMTTTDMRSNKAGTSQTDRSTNESIGDKSAMVNNSHSESDNKVENRELTDTGKVTARTDYDLYSDTPQGSLNGVNNETYLTNARKNTVNGQDNGHTNSLGVGTSENTGDVTQTGNSVYSRDRENVDNMTSTEKYIDHTFGYAGYVPSDLLQKYRDTFLNIDVMIIQELEPLFMQLW